MDIFFQIYGYAYRTICNIPDVWVLKLAGGAILATVVRHTTLFTVFSFLVGIDLFAKFIALSYAMIKAQGDDEPSLLDAVKAIPEAHRQRIINSHEMKAQFTGKIIVYIIAVMAAGIVDFMIGHANFGPMVIAYLSSTELLSIVENLDDAGVSAVHDLAALIKRKRG